MRDHLASLPTEPLQALKFLQSLAQAAWGEADLRLLGRKVRGIVRSADFASEARKHGLAQVRILILSASTASHISDVLIGSSFCSTSASRSMKSRNHGSSETAAS